MSKWDKVFYVAFLMLISFACGYYLRMYHQENYYDSLREQGRRNIILQIKKSTEDGYVFFIENIKFIPRKDGACVVKKCREFRRN